MRTPADFWARVDLSGECWLWLGAKTGTGYGMAFWSRKQTTAHRIAYALSHHVPLPKRTEYVLHSCDTKACVRPSHLSLGDASRNLREAYARGLKQKRRRP